MSSSDYKISTVGCKTNLAEAQIVADLQILVTTLQASSNHSLSIQNIFVDNSNIPTLFRAVDSTCSWHLLTLINRINPLLSSASNPHIHVIPRDWLKVSVKLAIFG